MDIPEDSVAKAKKTLARMAKQKKASVTGRELVRDLAPEIHARLKDGHGLKAIWFMIVTDLPEGERMTFATFQKYWQESRQALGLTPLKFRTLPMVPASKGPHFVPPPAPRPEVRRGTSSDFRVDPEGI